MQSHAGCMHQLPEMSLTPNGTRQRRIKEWCFPGHHSTQRPRGTSDTESTSSIWPVQSLGCKVLGSVCDWELAWMMCALQWWSWAAVAGSFSRVLMGLSKKIWSRSVYRYGGNVEDGLRRMMRAIIEDIECDSLIYTNSSTWKLSLGTRLCKESYWTDTESTSSVWLM